MYLPEKLPKTEPPPPPLTVEQKRKALVRILRDHKLWPKDFTWYYPEASKCAIGLARRCGLDDVSRNFGLSDQHYNDVAYQARSAYGGTKWFGLRPKFPEVDEVTPERVADLIEHFAKLERA